MVEIKNILFPYDLTEHGPTIVPYVLSFAEKYNCAVTSISYSLFRGAPTSTLRRS